MQQTIEKTITESEDGMKIRSILKNVLGFSSHAIASLTHTESGILVNGRRPLYNVILHRGDHLCVQISDRKPPVSDTMPCDIPLEIVYEDEFLLIINKPAGMVSLFSRSHPDTPSVPGALVHHLGGYTPFHIVSRLDKGTSGLMVIAKNGYTHNRLRTMLHTSEFRRGYRGICVGCPSPESGVIDLPIGRDEDSIVKRAIRPDGAPSVSCYQVLQRCGKISLLSLFPQTGRTHQLRVHCAAIGHPLVGDWLYGHEAPELIGRPALHSAELWLNHPVFDKELYFTVPVPQDMGRLLQEEIQG
jgi:RluA family pseudouridine synthase